MLENYYKKETIKKILHYLSLDYRNLLIQCNCWHLKLEYFLKIETAIVQS